MSAPTRLDLIEIKLAHVEQTLSELNGVIIRQQRELERLAVANRELTTQLQAVGGADAGTEGFERPPHY